MKVTVDFCGDLLAVVPGRPVTIGREGDVELDDNPYLHRRFLEVSVRDGIVWLSNCGALLSATVVDDARSMQAWLAPGARLPLVFERSRVRFAAGPTSYELEVLIEGAEFMSWEPVPALADTSDRTETIGQAPLTQDQHLLIVALAEPLLRQEGRGSAAIPSSADAARRLGWSLPKFTRKLDNVCSKFDRLGVPGLRGDAGRLAANRRARLVEYALSVGVVGPADLVLLDDLRAELEAPGSPTHRPEGSSPRSSDEGARTSVPTRGRA